jgi:ABC-type dipeptide/oligopeptide/nickel transport system permease component
VLTILGLQFGSLLSGAIVTETVFSWPGIGRLTLSAISNRDYALVQGCILAIGLTYVTVNLLTDVAYTSPTPASAPEPNVGWHATSQFVVIFN